MIKSRIYLSDIVENKDPKPAANQKYYAAKLVDGLGKHYNLLFTEHDIIAARERGDKNEEDFPPVKVFKPTSIWSRLKFW